VGSRKEAPVLRLLESFFLMNNCVVIKISILHWENLKLGRAVEFQEKFWIVTGLMVEVIFQKVLCTIYCRVKGCHLLLFFLLLTSGGLLVPFSLSSGLLPHSFPPITLEEWVS